MGDAVPVIPDRGSPTARRLRSLLLAVTAALAGAVVVAPAPPVTAAGADDVLAFGASHHGSTGPIAALAAPVVGIAAHPAGGGYWEVAADGGVFAFGRAGFVPPTTALPAGARVVGIAADPDGAGYWVATAGGAVVGYDAPDHGSLAGVPLNSPVVGIAARPGGGGYWLAAADGGVFGFGAATFSGSAGGLPLNSPVVGIAASPAGGGYWLVAGDGGVFNYGAAPFLGAAGGTALAGKAAAGIAGDPASGGYWVALRRDPPPPPLPPARPVLRAGARNASVVALEQRLVALGYWLGRPDESFGYSTTHAVLALQKVAGLPRDGVVNRATWQALEAGVRPVAASRTGRVIEINKARQVLVAVKDGKVEWIFDTSTGRAGLETPSGRFKVYSQIEGNYQGQYRSKFFYAPRALAIHGYPSVPTSPYSHGCARVINPAMDFIWAAGLAPVGAAVWVS